MNEDPDRLSDISTMWTQIRQAHQPSTNSSEAAKLEMIERYQGAAFRYLFGALRDRDMAEDAFQDFAVRVLEGRFQGASETKGRFRDYLRTSLSHIITDHRRKKAKNAGVSVDLPFAEPAAQQVEDDSKFLDCWRSELLARAWLSLSTYESETGKPFHTILKAKVEHHDLPTQELAKLLEKTVPKEYVINPTNLRKLVQRAREKFSDFLIDEVASSIGTRNAELIEQELIDLHLHIYCGDRIR